MKLKDLEIGTQIRLGLGTLLALVGVLGAVAWVQMEDLWGATKGLHDHPFVVQGAVGNLRADLHAIRRDMLVLVVAQGEAAREPVLAEIAAMDEDAARRFTMLRNAYLGPQRDIEQAEAAFSRWRAEGREMVRMLQAGRSAEALERVRPTGVGGRDFEEALARVRVIDDFSRARSDQFYHDAEDDKRQMAWQFALVLAVIVLLSTAITFLLLAGIKDPLRELTRVADQHRQGRYDVRSTYASANEVGRLSSALNALAGAVQEELQARERTATVADVMLRNEDPRAFGEETLRSLMEQTGSQVGAIYLLDDAGTSFELLSSIGLPGGARPSFSATAGEGELGLALATRKIQHLADIPADTAFTVVTAAGDFRPREMITVPILSGQDVVAVVSLAGVRGYPSQAVKLVHDVWGMLTARLNGVLAYRRLRVLSDRLEQQNRELEAQKRELAQQADGLAEQNIELGMQKKQLEDADRLKSAFLSNMSHELRTPLNSVIALSGVLGRRLAGMIAAEEYSYIEVIERNGKNLLALINDILDLSRIEAGHEEVNVAAFPVNELVEDVVATVAPQAREKKVGLHHRVDASLPALHSDYQKCRHILQNLVANAVKFTHEGQVDVSAAVVDGGMQIAVKDTGIGIRPEQRDYIFDEFRQGDESTTRIYGGSGLGLAIARRYATLLQGTLEVASTPGEGSVFTLRLPLSLDGAAPSPSVRAPRPRPPPAPARGGAGRTILVVEDSEPAVVQLRDILVGQGYRVVVARNGREALERTAEALPDAVILDLMMPEVDGFQALRTIRSTPRTSTLPVLILTARHVTHEELAFLENNNIHELIRKGDVDRDELLAHVAEMVAPRTAVTAAARRPVRAGRPVVLVVEDNADNLLSIRAMLGSRYDIIEATNGKAGVEKAAAERPDLVLMDVSLPVMDGVGALKALKGSDALRGIPVIAVTARAMKGDREELLAHGFDGYVSKPLDAKVLSEVIRGKIHGET